MSNAATAGSNVVPVKRSPCCVLGKTFETNEFFFCLSKVLRTVNASTRTVSYKSIFNGHQENTFLSLSLSWFSSNVIFLILTIAIKITRSIFNRVKNIAVNKKNDIIDDETWESKQDKNSSQVKRVHGLTCF